MDLIELPRPKVLISDLDNTLAHADRDYQSLWESFSILGISKETAEAAYLKNRKFIFSPSNYALALEEVSGSKVDPHLVQGIIYKWLHGAFSLYPDVPYFWESLKDIPRIILTAGDKDYQKEKIDMLGLHYEDFIAVSTQEDKALEVKTLLHRYNEPLWWIDDSPLPFDAWHHFKISGVTTVRILREDSPYASLPVGKEYLAVSSLAELNTLHL